MKFRYIGESSETLEHPFPTEPETRSETRPDGSCVHYLVTPPIQSFGKAYRYSATLQVAADGKVLQEDWVLEMAEGWSSYVSRENWAAMALRDGGRSFTRYHNRKVPKALYLRWYDSVLRFLYQHNPKRLTEALEGIEYFKKSEGDERRRQRQKTAAHEERYGKIGHGDVVFTRTPLNFTSGDEAQIFVMIAQDGRAGRKKLVPHIYKEGRNYDWFVPCNIRRSQRTDFLKVGTAAFEDLSGLSAHEKFKAAALAQKMRERAEAGTLNP